MNCKVVSLTILLCLAGILPTLSISTLALQPNDGSLSGYIIDTNMNPIDGAKISISCGNNTLECYSNATGYYHKEDIPIIFCIWNVSVEKAGYIPNYYNMPIGENSTHNFTLMLMEVIDLEVTVLRGPTYSSPIVKVKNTGNSAVHTIRIVDVNVSGPVVYNNRESLLTTSIAPGEVIYGTINSWFFGFGVFSITVTIACDEGVFLSDPTNGLIFLSFVFIP